MKKILSAFLFVLFLPVFANGEEFFGIGAELFKDPFNNKVIFTKILPDSPLQKEGIVAGTELISVDGVKVKKLCLCETISKIRGEEGTEIKIRVRNGWRWKTYNIKRTFIKIDELKTNPNLENHWRQVASICFECPKMFDKEVANKFSAKYRKTVLPAVNYWFQRKAVFEEGYNLCMKYSKNNQEICLINLLNRENQKTLADKKIYKVLRDKLD